MTGSPMSRCPSCGADLVVEMDPASPPDAHAVVLCADPPFRLVCASPECPGGPAPSSITKGK